MIQSVAATISADQFDLFEFPDRCWYGHIVWPLFQAEHGLLQEVIYSVSYDKGDKLNKKLSRHRLVSAYAHTLRTDKRLVGTKEFLRDVPAFIMDKCL